MVFAMKTHNDIMDLWHPRTAFAREAGVSEVLAQAWYTRKNIPVEHWPAVVKAAHARGYTQVTIDLLAATAKRRKRRDDPPIVECMKAC